MPVTTLVTVIVKNNNGGSSSNSSLSSSGSNISNSNSKTPSNSTLYDTTETGANGSTSSTSNMNGTRNSNHGDISTGASDNSTSNGRNVTTDTSGSLGHGSSNNPTVTATPLGVFTLSSPTPAPTNTNNPQSTVSENQSAATPKSTIIVATVIPIILALIAAIGLFMYLRKRQRDTPAKSIVNADTEASGNSPRSLPSANASVPMTAAAIGTAAAVGAVAATRRSDDVSPMPMANVGRSASRSTLPQSIDLPSPTVTSPGELEEAVVNLLGIPALPGSLEAPSTLASSPPSDYDVDELMNAYSASLAATNSPYTGSSQEMILTPATQTTFGDRHDFARELGDKETVLPDSSKSVIPIAAGSAAVGLLAFASASKKSPEDRAILSDSQSRYPLSDSDLDIVSDMKSVPIPDVASISSGTVLQDQDSIRTARSSIANKNSSVTRLDRKPSHLAIVTMANADHAQASGLILGSKASSSSLIAATTHITTTTTVTSTKIVSPVEEDVDDEDEVSSLSSAPPFTTVRPKFSTTSIEASPKPIVVPTSPSKAVSETTEPQSAPGPVSLNAKPPTRMPTAPSASPRPRLKAVPVEEDDFNLEAYHPPAPTSHVVIQAYIPLRPDEMLLQEGDLMGIEREFEDGWARGQNISQGRKRCMFPLAIVTPIRSGPSQTVVKSRGNVWTGKWNKGSEGSSNGAATPSSSNMANKSGIKRRVAIPARAASVPQSGKSLKSASNPSLASPLV